MTARLSRAELPVQQREPIQWSFRRLVSDEDEAERHGIAITHVQPMSFYDNEHDEARADLPLQLQVQLDAAAAKFHLYTRQVRVVLFDFYSQDLTENDVPPAFEKAHIPESIDEVWRTIQDWISADDFRVGYERVFLRVPSTVDGQAVHGRR